jgi:signal peptidase I
MKSFIREILITLGIALVVFLLLQTTIQSSIVEGSSMQPSLEDGQRLIVLKAIYRFSEPERGDIIIIHPPVSPQKQWVKRVIGLPEDTVEVKDGKVYVNGFALIEPYLEDPPNYTLAPYKVPANNYFVMGDNRNHSTDSHYKWTVTRDNIVGEVWLRIWPFSTWGIIQGYSFGEIMP